MPHGLREEVAINLIGRSAAQSAVGSRHCGMGGIEGISIKGLDNP